MSPSYGFRRNFSSSHSVIAGKKRILRGCRDPRRNLNLALCLPAGHRVTPVPCLHLATASPFAGFLKIRRLVCLRLWCTLWWCGEAPEVSVEPRGGEKAAPAAWGWSDRFHTGNRALLPSPSRRADTPRAPPPVLLPDATHFFLQLPGPCKAADMKPETGECGS